jgi:hypothetical protein
MDKANRYLDKFQQSDNQALSRKVLMAKLKECRECNELVNTKGWKALSKRIKDSVEETGRLAVWPGLKDDIRDDRLTRANERMKVIFEVETLAGRIEELEEKWRLIKDLR